MQSYLTTEVPIGVRVYLPHEVDPIIAAKDAEIAKEKALTEAAIEQINRNAAYSLRQLNELQDEYVQQGNRLIAAEARERELRQRIAELERQSACWLEAINDVQNALGFDDDEKASANGSIEIVVAIEDMREDVERLDKLPQWFWDLRYDPTVNKWWLSGGKGIDYDTAREAIDGHVTRGDPPP